MNAFPSLRWLPALALAACATTTAGPPPASPELPPRLGDTDAAEPAGIVGLSSLCGVTVVGNAGELHFRMDLAGSKVSVRHGVANDAYVVDGLAVQVKSVPGQDISPTARTMIGMDLLRTYVRFETAVQVEKLGRTVEPEEGEILAADNMPSALVWWLPNGQPESVPTAEPSADLAEGREAGDAAAPNRPTGIAFVTAAYGHRVLVLSVQGMHGERKADLVAKAKAWMSTVVTSPQTISSRQISADIKAAVAAGQTCPGRPNAILEDPAPVVEAVPEPDRRLRLDGLPEDAAAQIRVAAQAQGGVVRLRTPAGVQYTNDICHFALLLPTGWQELSVKDFNGRDCLMDLTTAEVTDTSQPKPVSNAVVILAAKSSASFGRDALHQQKLGSLKGGNARITRPATPLVDDALEDHYLSQQDGHAYEGDLVTLQRGENLYQILFTATPGSYAAGKVHFVEFLRGAKWGVEGK
jgi:hypothetical protein